MSFRAASGHVDEALIGRVLVPVAGQEDYVRGRFWDKVRRVAGRVPLLDRVIAVYYAAVDPATPVHVRGVLFAALAYFVLPTDAIPDILAGIGFTDDMAVLAVVVRTLAPHIRAEHAARARAWLTSGRADRKTA